MATTTTVSAPDGHEFTLRIAEADGPTLLFLSAMGVRASYYDQLADRLADQGIRTATCDLRGHGTSSWRSSRSRDFGYVDVLQKDFPAMVDAVGAEKLTIGGHSLGGQLGLIYAGLDARCTAVALVAACVPSRRGFDGRLGQGLKIAGYAFPAVARAVGYFPGPKIGFGGRESRGVISDWAHCVRTGDYPEPWESALRDVQVPVLAAEVEGDTWAPGPAIDLLMQKCPRADVVRTVIPSTAPRPHFGWVREEDPAVEELSRFMGV